MLLAGQPVQSWDELPDGVRALWSKWAEMVPPPPLMLELTTGHLDVGGFNPRELAEKAALDPVLAGKLLGAVNSAAFGLVQPMTSVQRAVVHLGFNLVKSILVSCMLDNSVGSKFSIPVEHREYVRAWSAGAAILAQHWAKAADLPDPSTASTVGLLSRIGTLLLAAGEPRPGEDYRALGDETSRLGYEMERYQITTPVLSSHQCRLWKLPDPIPQLVERTWEPLFTSLPSTNDNRLVALAAAAGQLAEHFFHAPDDGPSVVLDNELNAVLKSNLVELKLLEPLQTAWAARATQRDLISILHGGGVA
jgi:HD-like signal output (HDOD) protein